MRVHGGAVAAVGGIDIIRTGRKDHQTVHFEGDALEHLAAMLHGQQLGGIRRNEGPGIHHLGAVGIDNPQAPAGLEWNGQTMPGGNRNSISIWHPYNVSIRPLRAFFRQHVVKD